MGQKCHPYGLRLGIIRPWLSRWYADGNRYTEQLLEDVKLRRRIRERLRNAAVSQIVIDRAGDQVTVTLHTARPGVIIGHRGSGVERLSADLERMCHRKVHITVEEIKRPELDAHLVAESIANQIERRISFRRAMKQSIQRSMRMGAQGMKVVVSGRLGGAEIAHSEGAKSPEGRVPLHTLRADIDYGLCEARTAYGHIGVKVWIYKGDIIPERRRSREPAAPRAEETVRPPRPPDREGPATVEELKAADLAPLAPSAPEVVVEAVVAAPPAPPAPEVPAEPATSAEAESAPAEQGEQQRC